MRMIHQRGFATRVFRFKWKKLVLWRRKVADVELESSGRYSPTGLAVGKSKFIIGDKRKPLPGSILSLTRGCACNLIRISVDGSLLLAIAYKEEATNRVLLLFQVTIYSHQCIYIIWCMSFVCQLLESCVT